MLFGMEKLDWLGYQIKKKFEDMFICFDRIHKRDGRTHGHTHKQLHDGSGRACIASCGKNSSMWILLEPQIP